MMRTDAILRLAGIIPEHNLKEVRSLPNYNTWGVDSQPGQLPSILYIGDGSRDFGASCWPFMAAHEGLHSIATHFLQADDYRFVLYNICEDWRINLCLRGVSRPIACGMSRNSFRHLRSGRRTHLLGN